MTIDFERGVEKQFGFFLLGFSIQYTAVAIYIIYLDRVCEDIIKYYTSFTMYRYYIISLVVLCL